MVKGADGLSGNDDCGQMSAWYLFSSLGFYPVTPASGEYALGIPRFPSARVELPHGKVLTVRAEGLKEHKHLPVILFNGKKLDAPFIAIRDLMKGGVLEFKAE
jgi:putative alpha-1,2-mannosidase